MSKLLDFMERISDGSPAPLGFGAARAVSLPGMALVGLVTNDHQQGITAAAEAGLDAAILYGVDGADDLKSLGESLSGIPWGAYVAALSEDAAQACRDGGADLVAFTLDGTAAAAITGEDDLARILSVSPRPGRPGVAGHCLPVGGLLCAGYERRLRPVDAARPG